MVPALARPPATRRQLHIDSGPHATVLTGVSLLPWASVRECHRNKRAQNTTNDPSRRSVKPWETGLRHVVAVRVIAQRKMAACFLYCPQKRLVVFPHLMARVVPALTSGKPWGV